MSSETLRPVADGNEQTNGSVVHDPPELPYHTSAIDEVALNTSDRIRMGYFDDYLVSTLENLNVANATINFITIYAYVLYPYQGLGGNARLGCSINGTRYWAGYHNFGNGELALISNTWATNPATGSAWTLSDVNNLRLALNVFSTYSNMYQAWVVVDFTYPPPNTPSTPTGDTPIVVNESHIYSAAATDPNGFNVYLTFDWGDGTQDTTGWLASGQTGSKSHSWSSAGTKSVQVRATNIPGYSSSWSGVKSVVVTNRPNAPSTPSGDALILPSTSHAYTTVATDPDGDNIAYYYVWGDGNTEYHGQWVASGTQVSLSHSWVNPGVYYITTYAYDWYGVWGPSSPTKTIRVNSNPNTPSIPSGPALVNANVSGQFTSTATDPDGDTVAVKFNWGDGNESISGFVASGTPVTLSHTWTVPGTYLVKCMAIDGYGFQSGWSSTLTVTVVSGGSYATCSGLW